MRKTPLTIALTAATAFAAALALTACNPGEPVDPADAPADPTPAVTIFVTEEAEDEIGVNPDFGFTYFQGAELGQTFEEAGVALHMGVAGAFDCPYYGTLWSTEIGDTYAFTNFDSPGDGISLFYAQTFSDATGASWPRNAEGLGLGSTQEEILAAYPDAVVELVNDMGVGDITRILVDDQFSDSRYAFGITSGATAVDLLQWGPNAGNQWSHLCGGF